MLLNTYYILPFLLDNQETEGALKVEDVAEEAVLLDIAKGDDLLEDSVLPNVFSIMFDA